MGDLKNKTQVLDLWRGVITSNFFYNGSQLRLEVSAVSELDTIIINVESELLDNGSLGLFFDFPYSDVNKLDAPFVGVWNAPSEHSTFLETSNGEAKIQHTTDDTSYCSVVRLDGVGQISGSKKGTHRYLLTTPGSKKLNLTATFLDIRDCSTSKTMRTPSASDLAESSKSWWQSSWESGGFH